MRHQESRLQKDCVKWFRYQYPQFNKLFFSIPNGGKRDVITASIMKAEGTVSGVTDLMLAVPRKNHHGMFIEMKFGKGKLTDDQELFKSAVEKYNYKHVTCYSFDEFEREINFYLQP